jgi:hypothetical protein
MEGKIYTSALPVLKFKGWETPILISLTKMTSMRKNFWMTLAILLAFLLLIELLYNLVLSRKKAAPALQKIEKAETDIRAVIERLELTESSINTAISNIETGRAGIEMLRKDVEVNDEAYRNSLLRAGTRLDSMGRSFEDERKRLEDLRNELEKLK